MVQPRVADMSLDGGTEAELVERRKHKRIQSLIDRESVALVRHHIQTLPASIVNLSADGALLKFPYSRVGLESGTPVSLWLDSGGTLFEIEAVVVRTEPGHIALHFPDMTARNEAELRTKLIRMEMIAARSKKEQAKEATPQISG